MTDTIPNVPRELLERAAISIEQRMCIQCEGVPCCMPESLSTLLDIRALLSTPSPAGVDGLEVVAWNHGYLQSMITAEAKADLERDNNLLASGYCEPLCRLSDAQAIIDGLRGEVARMSKEKSARQALSISLIDEARALRTERDQQAQRIGELEGLLLACHSTLYPFDNKVLEAEIDAACLPARSWSDG